MKRHLIATGVATALFALTATAAVAHPGPGPGGPKGPRGSHPKPPQAFIDCMTKQGVEKPDRRSGPPSQADRAKIEAAFQQCKQHLPAAAVARHDALVKFRACLVAQGAPAKPARGTRLSEADRAKLQAAFAACKKLLPARP